ncbi:MAG: NAD(P)-dependent oxidoreductase [Chloroflexi bacterium]|nr:NAD(P)-dependent oxidoreductase [Chloroflexota bacterium]MDA1297006.1 NAD(P)-dependent oxidoreductase [Chloroflexota bacterium]
MREKVLITGMSGLIGGLAARTLSGDYEVSDIGRTPVDGWPYTVADIADFDSMRPAFDGVKTVIHMAASRGNQPFDVHYRANVIGVYNVLEAARQAGARRVILASTGAVVGGYEKDEPYRSMVNGVRPDTRPGSVKMITVDQPPRPRCLYAVTKLWSEAIGRAYSEAHGLSVLCIRVGKVEINNVPANARNAAVWCSHGDMMRLLRLCVAAPEDLRFNIFFSVSDNPLNYRDWSHAHDVLGYTPEDSAVQHGY